jgi:hypothetical protein
VDAALTSGHHGRDVRLVVIGDDLIWHHPAPLDGVANVLPERG